MPRTPHPAHRARRITALVSGASYLGLTSSIAVATTLSNQTDVVTTTDTAITEPDAGLALRLDGSATPPPSASTLVETEAPELPTTSDLVTSILEVPAESEVPTQSTGPITSVTESSTSRPPTTTAPTTGPTTTAPTSSQPPSSQPTTAPPTTQITTTTTHATTASTTATSQVTTTSTTQATTTTEATTTTQATTTTTQATTTTTSGAS